MDKPTHYVEARILPLDGPSLSGGDIAFVTSKIMAAVHRHIVDGNEIAVSFPELQESVVKDECGVVLKQIGTGAVIRIFGSAATLMSFLVRPDFAQLIGGAACSVGKIPVKEVPAETEWEILLRERSAEKNTESFAVRSDRRLRGRVVSGVSKMTEADLARRFEKIAKGKNTAMPVYVHMDSASTGKRFRLFFDRKPVDGFTVAEPTTYGMGVPVPVF